MRSCDQLQSCVCLPSFSTGKASEGRGEGRGASKESSPTPLLSTPCYAGCYSAVKSSQVAVNGQVLGNGRGLNLLVGIASSDTEASLTGWLVSA